MNYIGIDIGGTGIKAGLISANGEILRFSSIPCRRRRKAEQVIGDIIEQINKLAKPEEYEAIGIGCPGTIDSATGVVFYANNLNWRNVPLKEKIECALKKKVAVSNDANVAALGEAKFGAASKYDDSILITLGTGVGSGVIIDGKLYEGYKGHGTELGHMVIVSGGVQCTCGRQGCLESYASATALIRDTIFEMQVDVNSIMWDYVNGDLSKVDGRTSFECAKRGDASAKKVVDRYVKYLADGLVNFVDIFRPQAILLGGGISAQGEYLTKPLQVLVDKYRYGGEESLPCEIITAKLGNDAGILGAAALVMQ